MNNRLRADAWVKGALALRGKPLMIVESYKGSYLAVVDKNEGGFEMVLANSNSKKIEPFKKYGNSTIPIKVLEGEAKNRNLRIVLSTSQANSNQQKSRSPLPGERLIDPQPMSAIWRL